jgi:hypothetical protein
MVGEGVGVGVGDGEGVGVAVGVGVGVGEAVDVGDGATCACADETTPIASTKTIASSRANTRPAPIFSAHDAQRMIPIPEKAPARKNAQQADRQIWICAQFMRSVNRLRSSPRTE